MTARVIPLAPAFTISAISSLTFAGSSFVPRGLLFTAFFADFFALPAFFALFFMAPNTRLPMNSTISEFRTRTDLTNRFERALLEAAPSRSRQLRALQGSEKLKNARTPVEARPFRAA